MSRHPTNRNRTTRRRLSLQPLENRILAAADLHLLQNPFDPEDVNDDGTVTSGDVLSVINRLNRSALPPPSAATEEAIRTTQDTPANFADVNGDQVLTSNDVLRVLNRVHRDAERTSSPEGEPSGRAGRARPESPVPPATVRTIDGNGNNLRNPEWGTAGSTLLRTGDAEYADGITSPAGEDRPNPRDISNGLFAQEGSILNERQLTDMLWQWGQFLDHDLDLTQSAVPAEPLPITIPAGDPDFDPAGTGAVTMSFSRSNYDPATGTSLENPREQVNSITAFIDGSQIYGSDAETAASLRAFAGGKLKTSEGNLLPTDETGFFFAGDIRVNEQVGLVAMHTLWMREHNRIAERIARHQPELNDEQIYQMARAVVIGELQAITYNEFLPALLGRDAIAPYTGYHPEVNPGISNLFATAAYRFGHSMLSSEMARLDNDGQVIDAGNLALRDAFFNPTAVVEHGIDALLKGLATQQAQEIDAQLVDDVRNFLFGPPGAGGFDLAALNIQRGRDHGLADYNQSRIDIGLPAVTDFADISSDAAVQASLENLYGTVDNIDVWVGGLAEDHQPGASVGEFVQRVLADQFTRLRDGDRFWYQRVFSGPMLREIEHTRLADVIRRNTSITNLQRNVFLTPQRASGDAESPVIAPTPLAQQPENRPSEFPATRPNSLPAPTPLSIPSDPQSEASQPGGRRRGPAPRNADRPTQTSPLPGSAAEFLTAADELFGRLGR